MMNILIIAYYYPPIGSGGTMRPVQTAKYLERMGHHVTVLTHSYDKNTVETGKPQVLRFRDPSFNKCKTSFRKKIQWLGLRLYTEALNRSGIYHSIYSWWKQNVIKNADSIMARVKPNVIIATYPPVETLEIAVYLSKKYHIPMVSDFRDGLIFEPIESTRMNRYACIRKRYAEIEKEAVSCSAAVTTIAQPIADYYRETFHPPKVEVISNAFDPDDLKDLPPGVSFGSSFFNIVFTGRFAMSDKNNRVDFFFDAVRRLIAGNPRWSDKIRIHLVGEYRKAELKDLQDLIDCGIIILHGLVERGMSLAYQRAADLLLIITLPDRRSSVSAKIFEYLFAGKPVLALTYKTVLEDIVRETKTGWTVHPQDIDAIAALLKRIVEEPGFYHSIEPGLERVGEYSIQRQVEKLDALLRCL